MRFGAALSRVRTGSGADARLKRSASRREVTFYRDLALTVACRTPALLKIDESGDLLLADAGAEVPVRAWTEPMWVAAAEQLALLHATPLPPGDDWRRPDPVDAADPAAAADFWGPDLPRSVTGRARPPATTFIHGDCHTGNFVFDPEGRPTLCDWEAAVIGRPATDLAFFNVRSIPDDIVAPSALLTAYAARTGSDVDDLAREVAAEELAMLVLLWPEYAVYNTEEGIARVRARVAHLAAR